MRKLKGIESHQGTRLINSLQEGLEVEHFNDLEMAEGHKLYLQIGL